MSNAIQTLTPEALIRLKAALPTMPDKEKRKTVELLSKYYENIVKTKSREDFLTFIKHVYPGYKVGPHHYRLAKIFEEIAAGKKKRVIVNIAPRHGKSEMISYLAPAWFLGKYPQKKVIMASHTADLAVNFGRRVRNLVGSELYHDIFPQVELQADSKSASRWGTNFNGEYFAIGVGGALAGRGADLFIIDDPHSEQDAKQNRADVFNPAWEWFQSGPVQRLMPGGAIIVVMCMTGDTPVLMADGTEKRLDTLKINDAVATYDEGKLSTSRVLNWQSNGIDKIFTLSTRSGRILRANERHPFLVEQNGAQTWIRLSDLKPGMLLVATKGVIPPHALNLPLDISDFTVDLIESIIPSGQEEVFDVQIERTENFIANGVVSHNTRWSKMDLTGQIIDHMTRNDDSDEWEVVEFPAILNDKPLWPDFWPIEELLAKKASMDVRYWQAQYMQEPTSEEGALIKREWWQIWEQDNPPTCEFIIMSLDAAQETNNRADYNALTTWGVFYNENTKVHNIILLNAIKERLEFPELKTLVLEQYNEWKPDSLIVEKKSNGAALYQEMRRMGVPVSEFTPGRGQDKISRVNAVSDLFASGIVWTPDRRWAREVVEECNDFPSGKNDDLVDSTTLALLRFRQGGFVRLPSDEAEPIKLFKSHRRMGYY